MPTRLLIVLLALLFGNDDGTDAGRRGNALYESGNYAEAATAYRTGLDRLPDSTGTLATRLWNNLGMALHQQEAYDDALSAFRRAAGTAETESERARAFYNAGTTAAAHDQPDAALDLFRRALLADPTHDDARFNYEYLKRQQSARQPQSTPPERIEPSDFARELRRRAETLASNRQYGDAYRLMQEGLQQDSTVAAFQSFITRLGDVAQIDSLSP